MIRIESFERQRIHRMLDLGAEGIMCPRISTVEEARKFVAGLSYPPEGQAEWQRWSGQQVLAKTSTAILKG